ncbi:MAG: glycosyltransferase family 4 protein [Bacillota bacterium]|nr:glycosyltransferase family 4 protein [Bacillota bacterium]
MNILILSWEYPPRNIGGISTHVYNLSHSLKEQGHQVTVITCNHDSAPLSEEDSGVTVYRTIPFSIPVYNFTEWVNHLNYSIIEQCIKLFNEGKKFDVLHIHDWLVAYAGKVIKDSYKLPLISTIHSTEYGRNNGIYSDLQKYISAVENFILHESDRVICCSPYMKEHISSTFEYAAENVAVIPNGVRVREPDMTVLEEFRKKFGAGGDRILLFIGRHVYEKGIQLLIEAAPIILSKHNNVKFIIAGSGPMTEELKKKADISGLSERFIFTGFIENNDKEKLLRIADALIVPSLYEPFGIVALEGMAAECAVIASDCGGLKEIISHNEDGLTFASGSIYELASRVNELLDNGELKQKLTSAALSKVQDNYNWSKTAELTADIYKALVPKRRKSATKKSQFEGPKDNPSEKTAGAVKKTRKSTKKKAEVDISE